MRAFGQHTDLFPVGELRETNGAVQFHTIRRFGVDHGGQCLNIGSFETRWLIWGCEIRGFADLGVLAGGKEAGEVKRPADYVVNGEGADESTEKSG